jgi:hypothetical protein
MVQFSAHIHWAILSPYRGVNKGMGVTLDHFGSLVAVSEQMKLDEYSAFSQNHLLFPLDLGKPIIAVLKLG